jgi:hypothetical protein
MPSGDFDRCGAIEWRANAAACLAGRRICLGSSRPNRCTALAGPKADIGEADSRSWQLRRVRYEIGRFDLDTCRLEPVDNPFGAKLVTMSPVLSANHVAGMHPRLMVGRAGLEPATNGLKVKNAALRN